jgi:hypothetical protein
MSVHTWLTRSAKLIRSNKRKPKQPAAGTLNEISSVAHINCFRYSSSVFCFWNLHRPGKAHDFCAAHCDSQYMKYIICIAEWLKEFPSTRRGKLSNAFVPTAAPRYDVRQYTHSYSLLLDLPAFQLLLIKTPRSGQPIIFHTGWAFNTRTVRACLSRPVENHFNQKLYSTYSPSIRKHRRRRRRQWAKTRNEMSDGISLISSRGTDTRSSSSARFLPLQCSFAWPKRRKSQGAKTGLWIGCSILLNADCSTYPMIVLVLCLGAVSKWRDIVLSCGFSLLDNRHLLIHQ